MLSRAVGWLADRRIPTFLRPALYGAFCRLTGARAEEARLGPRDFPSLSAFFVRELQQGSRPLDPDPGALLSPVDGRVQALCETREGQVLEAKGRSYALAQLLGDADLAGALVGGLAYTLYLSPKDYHRIHMPLDAELVAVHWLPGGLDSVAPKVLAKRSVLSVNERAVLHFKAGEQALAMVFVGALNVGRIRVVGVPTGESGPLAKPRAFARGAEVGRFELGSTVVLVTPPGLVEALPGLQAEDPVQVGARIGSMPQ